MKVLAPLSPSHSRPPENPNAAFAETSVWIARVRSIGAAIRLPERALEVQVVVGGIELDALADAAAGAEPRLQPTRAAADALGRAARNRVNA